MSCCPTYRLFEIKNLYWRSKISGGELDALGVHTTCQQWHLDRCPKGQNVHVEVAVVKKNCYIPPNLPLPASSLISPSLDLSVFLSIVVDCWALAPEYCCRFLNLQAETQLKGQKKKSHWSVALWSLRVKKIIWKEENFWRETSSNIWMQVSKGYTNSSKIITSRENIDIHQVLRNFERTEPSFQDEEMSGKQYHCMSVSRGERWVGRRVSDCWWTTTTTTLPLF